MSHQAQDNSVFERRLRPIYDNLEVGNNRKALQETEKLLRKHPNLLCIKALKGLALLRLGRYEESHGFLQVVANERPADDATLQVLSFCYKELEQLDKIVDLYSHAVKQQPTNEELLAHLFISYVRLEDFKSQQSVALQLYKAHPKNAYYFWAVISVVLQGIRGPESGNSTKRHIYLSLAQRMVDKMIQENKLKSEQEVSLYIQILKLQNKYMEALHFLNGSICTKLYPGAPAYTKINILKELQKWKELNVLLKELLMEDAYGCFVASIYNRRDRWDYYKDYLTSCFQLFEIEEEKDGIIIEETNKSKTGTEKLSILDECHDFVCELVELSGKKVRGPYLARLELYRRMRAENLNVQVLLGDFCEMISEYFHLFGDKSCCTRDIALFLPALTLRERQQLANKLLQESGDNSIALPQNKNDMQKHICALQISRLCGLQMNLEIDHLLAFYTALKLHYEHGLSMFGKNLLPTDMGPSDSYALLAANVMYDISQKEQKSDRIFEALCLLQYVLRNSTSNFHVKLMSLKIYHLLGCQLGAQEMYEYLDIKQIQLDSMGYAHCNALILSGRFSMSRSLFDTTLKFFSNSYKERLDYLALTYRFCTFSKIEEFMNFKDRLTNSLHYVITSVEAQLCDLVILYGNLQQNLATYALMNIDPTEDRIHWHKLSDNRDLNALTRWDPIHLVELETERADSFEQEIEILRIRSLLLRMIASFINLFHPTLTAKGAVAAATADVSPAATTQINNSACLDKKEISIIEFLRNSWLDTFKRLRPIEIKPLPNRFLVNLLPTRLHLLLEMPYEKFFNDLSLLVLDLYLGSTNLPQQCDTINADVVALVDISIYNMKESDAAIVDGLWRRRDWQSRIACCLEMLSLYAFVLSAMYEKFQRTSNVKPKKKSTNENRDVIINEKDRCYILVNSMRHLKKEFQRCDTQLQIWKTPALPRDLSSFMADMSLKPEVEATLIGDVASVFKESHELMVTELRNLLKDKIRMVGK